MNMGKGILLGVIGVVGIGLAIFGIVLLCKHFKEQLDSMKVLSITAIVVVLSPYITYAIALLAREIKAFGWIEAVGSADAWIGFSGSIIGGSVTMLALYLTFRHEKEKDRQQYIDSIKPYISCRISNCDEDERMIEVGDCIENYGFIRCKMKNISCNIANVTFNDQYISVERENGVYEKQENLDQYGISIYSVQLDNGFFLAPKDDYKWNINFGIELDEEGKFKFVGNAFAFRYTVLFEITDVLKEDTYVFAFDIDINININTEGKPILFLENQQNTIIESKKHT